LFTGLPTAVKTFSFLVLSVLLASSLPAHAQDDSECPVGELQPLEADAASDSTGAAQNSDVEWAKRSNVSDSAPAASVPPATEAEAFVQDRIAEDGLHVVHFWAPWCPNSTVELENGWAGFVADNPKVTFTFVTVWNDNEDGAAVLDDYDLPDRVAEVTQPDLGPSDDEATRRHSFLSIPVTWIPSTWIFHQNGELAFAMNYGEMDMSTIQSLLDATRADW
jgi:hypothetical protein